MLGVGTGVRRKFRELGRELGVKLGVGVTGLRVGRTGFEVGSAGLVVLDSGAERKKEMESEKKIMKLLNEVIYFIIIIKSLYCYNKERLLSTGDGKDLQLGHFSGDISSYVAYDLVPCFHWLS